MVPRHCHKCRVQWNRVPHNTIAIDRSPPKPNAAKGQRDAAIAAAAAAAARPTKPPQLHSICLRLLLLMVLLLLLLSTHGSGRATA
jgi:hypothetical protein